MNRTIKYLIIALLLALSPTARADDGVIVLLRNGASVGFAFNDKPVVSMGNEVTLTSSTGQKISYAFDDVRWITFGEVGAPTPGTPTAKLSGRLDVDKWDSDAANGLCLYMTLTMVNSGDGDFNDSIRVEYYPILNKEIFLNNDEGNTILQKVAAKDSTKLSFFLSELDSKMDEYQVDAYYRTAEGWKSLVSSTVPMQSVTPVTHDNPDMPDTPDNSDLVILFNNGQTVGFSFSDKPVIETGNGGTMVVKTTSGQSVTYAYDDVKQIYFGDGTTGIKAVKAQDAERPVFRVTTDGIDVYGLAENDEVSAYTIGGAVVGKAKAVSGHAYLSLPQSQQVYIVRTKSGISFKFTNK